MEENVVPFATMKRGLKLIVKAHFRVDPQAQLIFYDAEYWVDKDHVCEILKSYPSNPEYKTMVTLKSGKVLECLSSYESIVRQMESRNEQEEA